MANRVKQRVLIRRIGSLNKELVRALRACTARDQTKQEAFAILVLLSIMYDYANTLHKISMDGEGGR